MAKHLITLTVEFDDTDSEANVLPDLARGFIDFATDAYAASASPDGRQDGYPGPFLLTIDATVDGQEVKP